MLSMLKSFEYQWI